MSREKEIKHVGVTSKETELFFSETMIRRLLMSEFTYWRDTVAKDGQSQHSVDLVNVGAMAAASNLLAAISGVPAPWHADKENWSRHT